MTTSSIPTVVPTNLKKSVNFQQLLNFDKLVSGTVIDARVQGLYSEVLTTEEMSQPTTTTQNSATFGGEDGQDLELTINGKVLYVQNYFANNGKAAFKYLVGKDYDDSFPTTGEYTYSELDYAAFVNNNLYDEYNFQAKYGKSAKLTGTAFADQFDLSEVNTAPGKKGEGFTLNAAGGNDTITGSKFNDTLIGGTGHNKIAIKGAFGKDTYTFTKNETLNVTTTGIADNIGTVIVDPKVAKSDIELSVQDVVASVKSVSNVAVTTAEATTTAYTYTVTLAKTNEAISGITGVSTGDAAFYDVTYTWNATGDSWGAPTAIGTNLVANTTAEAEVTTKSYVATINGTALSADASAALINTAGDGKPYATVYVVSTLTQGYSWNAENKVFDAIGSTTPALTYVTTDPGDSTTIKYTDANDADHTLTAAEYTALSTVVKDVEDSNLNILVQDYGTLVLKNLAKTDITASTLVIPGVTVDGTAIEFNYTGKDVVKGKLTTTAVNDNVDLTINADSIESGVKINTGEGDDVITGTKFNDTITGGTGQNEVAITGVFGEDTYTFTKGESLNITTSGIIDNIGDVVVNPFVEKSDVLVSVKDEVASVKSVTSVVSTVAEAESASFERTEIGYTAGQAITLKVVSEGEPAQTKVYSYGTGDYDNDVTETYGSSLTPVEDNAYQVVFINGTTYTKISSLAQPDATYQTATDATLETTTISTWANGAESWTVGNPTYSLTEGTGITTTYYATINDVDLNSETSATLISDGNPAASIYVVTTVTQGYNWNDTKKAFEEDSDSGTSFSYNTDGSGAASTIKYIDNNDVDHALTDTQYATLAAAVNKTTGSNENIVVTDYGTLTLKGLAINKTVDSVAIDGNLCLVDNDPTTNVAVAFNENVTIKSNKVVGTNLGDVVAGDSQARIINTLAGNDSIVSLAADTITAGAGDDIITYNSSLPTAGGATSIDKTIFLTKNEELYINDTLTAVKDYDYSYNGKDVVATVTSTNGTEEKTDDKVTKFIFKNMAAKDIGADVSFGGGQDIGGGINDSVRIRVDADSMGNFTGSWLNDSITAGSSDAIVKLGGGYYNDIKFNSSIGTGKNTVILNKNERINITDTANYTNTVAGDLRTFEFTYDEKNKNDVVLTVKDQPNGAAAKTSTFVFKNYAAKDIGAEVEVNGYTIDGTTATPLVNETLGNGLFDAAVTVKADDKKTYKGSWLNDAATVAAAGSTFNLGGGWNTISFNSAESKGDNIVKLSKDEKLQIDNTTAGPTQYNLTYGKTTKDVVLTYTNGTDTLTDDTSFTFTGLGAKDTGARVYLADNYQNSLTSNNSIEAFESTKANKAGGYDYTGTWLNDSISGNAEMSDTFKLAGGVNTIIENGNFAFGNDTVTLTKGETAQIDVSSLTYKDQLQVNKVGNNIVLNTYNLDDVTYTKDTIQTNNVAITEGLSYEYTKTVVTLLDSGEHQGQYQTVVTTYTYSGSAWSDGVVGDPTYSEEGTEGTTYDAYAYVTIGSGDDAEIYQYDQKLNIEDPSGLPPTGVDSIGLSANAYAINSIVTTYTWDSANNTAESETAQNPIILAYQGTSIDESYDIYTRFDIKGSAEMDADEVNEFNTNIANKATYFTVSDTILEDSSVTLKNLGKDMSSSTVKIKNVGDGAWNTLGDIWTQTINIEATSAKTEGTFGNDYITLEEKYATKKGLKNTFVERYTSKNTYGNNVINSVQGAIDTIQVTTNDKAAVKLDAFDFDYDYTGNILTIDNGINTISYSTASSSGLLTSNIENVSFVDATNVKYQFASVNAATVNLSDKAKFKAGNNIVFSSVAAQITDGAKNDIIYGADAAATEFNYVNGGADKYIGGSANDTYNVNFNKKTDVTISDAGNGATASNDVLNIKEAEASNLMLFFDVEATNDGGNTFGIGENLIIMDKNAYSKANSFLNAIVNDKPAGGGIEIENYFSAAAVLNTTGASAAIAGANDDGLDGANGIGSGRIETVNVGSSAVNVNAKATTIASNVAAWLESNGNYDSAMAVLEGGNKQDIQSLLNVYSATTLA